LYLLFLDIPIAKQPSASINPVINQGFSFFVNWQDFSRLVGLFLLSCGLYVIAAG
jgi:hypothetical protein